MQTDFPEPVVPAISMCGIAERSEMSGVPEASLPRNMGSFIFSVPACAASMSSFSRTFSFLRFGTSMPTVSLPCMFATIRMFCTLSARARSEEILFREFTFVPGARRISKSVMTGPESMPTTEPLMRYVCSASSRCTAWSRTSASISSVKLDSGSSRMSSSGNL